MQTLKDEEREESQFYYDIHEIHAEIDSIADELDRDEADVNQIEIEMDHFCNHDEHVVLDVRLESQDCNDSIDLQTHTEEIYSAKLVVDEPDAELLLMVVDRLDTSMDELRQDRNTVESSSTVNTTTTSNGKPPDDALR